MPLHNQQHRDELDQRGFVLLPRVIAESGIASLIEVITATAHLPGDRRRADRTYAVRHLLWDVPELSPRLATVGVDEAASCLLGQTAFAISATLFDKHPEANWTVPGHQDLVMPVADRSETERAATAGFEGWSSKSGVTYVELPSDVLTGLVALRIHLDDCPVENGALAVVPESHRLGKLRDVRIVEYSRDEFELCAARAGDVLAMKPLLVHRSSPSQSPAHRRVLHVVYAIADPGAGVRWKR